MANIKQISFENIEKLFNNLIDSEIIEISNLQWIEPIGIALLKAYYDSTGRVIVFSHSQDRVVDYIKTILENSSGTSYIPFQKFTHDTDKITSSIVKLIIDNISNLNDYEKNDLSNYLKYMIGEVMDNVICHAKSELGGFITAQYYPRKNNKIQIVIIDNGIGLLKSLQDNYPEITNEEEAITKALEEGTSGYKATNTLYASRTHAGKGLYILSQIINITDGKLLIVSNDTIYRSNQNTFQKIETSFQGTLIAFELFEKNLEYEFGQIFKQITEKEELGEEDIFS